MDLRWHYGFNILAVARHGSRINERLNSVVFRAGDILLVQGPDSRVRNALQELNSLPLADRNLRPGRSRHFFLSISIFAATIGTATVGILPIPIALVSCAIAMILFKVVSLQEAYDSIDGPLIILLAAMIPVGTAMTTSGSSQLVVDALLGIASGFPPVGLVLIIMVMAMVLSAVVNNAAAALVMAPIALSLAQGVEVSPDPFLMAVAVGASSSFLTPIGHQSNTLAWGPGGYRFSDYARVGLPLGMVVVTVGLPMILLVWPL